MKCTDEGGQVVACRVGTGKQRVGSEIVSDVRRMDKEKERERTRPGWLYLWCYDGDCFRDLAYSSS